LQWASLLSEESISINETPKPGKRDTLDCTGLPCLGGSSGGGGGGGRRGEKEEVEEKGKKRKKKLAT
jgi:hypothetical protein